MILFNWKLIYKKATGNGTQILNIIYYCTYKPIPYNKFDFNYKYYEIDWSGTSFLINPKEMLRHRVKGKDKELAQYVALASCRNLGDYYVNAKKTLDLDLSPINQETLKRNRYISIEDDSIHFLWE